MFIAPRTNFIFDVSERKRRKKGNYKTMDPFRKGTVKIERNTFKHEYQHCSNRNPIPVLLG